MAYITKEKKAIIIARVKDATPKGWRVTFRMRHSSTIICTIRQADVDILAAVEAAYATLAKTRPSYETSGPVTHIQSLSPTTILKLPDPTRNLNSNPNRDTNSNPNSKHYYTNVSMMWELGQFSWVKS